MAGEGGGSVIQLEGHDLSVDDMMGGIAVRNVDPRVLADGLGHSLFEPLLEGARHVVDKGFLGLLQLLDGGVPRSYLFLQSLILHTEPADLDLQFVVVSLEKAQSLGLSSHLPHPSAPVFQPDRSIGPSSPFEPLRKLRPCLGGPLFELGE